MRIKGTLAWWMGGQGHAAVRYIAMLVTALYIHGGQALTFLLLGSLGVP